MTMMKCSQTDFFSHINIANKRWQLGFVCKVPLHQTRLALGCVTICRWIIHLSKSQYVTKHSGKLNLAVPQWVQLQLMGSITC